MSRGRRTPYKPPRNRREVTIAVLSSLAIVVVTATLLWVLRPNQDSGSAPTPVATTAPAGATSTSAPATTAAPTESTAPADTTPADTTPADSGATP
jgi:hypothetical protein